MFSKPFAVGLLVASCVAASGGAYIALRQNAVDASDAMAAPAAPAVRESEAVVTPPAAPAAPEPVERPSTAPAATVKPSPATTSGKATATPKTEPVRTRPANRPDSPRVENTTPAARPTVTAPAPEAPVASAPSAPAEVPPTRGENPAVVESASPDPTPVEPSALPAAETIELVVPAASVIGLQIETPVTTERARLEDRVEARVMRDVAVDGRTAIPAGTRALGSVTLVERGGKVKERARLGVRFHTLVLADGTQLPIQTETILREGESPTGESARKIGGATVGGAILGAIMGGKKGAIVGGATGAAGGTAVVMAGDRNAATLPAGAVVTVRISSPVPVEVERQEGPTSSASSDSISK
jgi:hypothetical protein